MEENKNEEQQEVQVEEKQEIIADDKKLEEKAEISQEVQKEKKQGKKGVILLVVLVFCLLVVGCGIVVFFSLKSNNGGSNSISTKSNKYTSEYHMSGNSVEKFDLVFLQTLEGSENKIYSPLSIKYVLAMLSEGANGDSKDQIDAIIGDYKPKKYENNENMSFANALFVRDSFKDEVLPSYIDNLKNKYYAEVIFDSFDNASVINSWVSDKTFNLIDGILDDSAVQSLDFALVNSLAIDMNWNYLMQPAVGAKIEAMKYNAHYPHEKFSDYVLTISDDRYPGMTFNGQENTKSVVVAATINNYDIISELGEDNIRKTVGDGYDEFLANGGCGYGTDPDKETFLDQYIKEIKTNYQKTDLSTDFMMYDDDSVKVFAKDLREYAGTTLQYVGIMPKNDSLENYVKNLSPEVVNNVIKSLKEIKPENFEEGTIINVKGNIPLFNYSFEFDLMESLKQLGVTDVFDSSKADLTRLVNMKDSSIIVAKHKATIDFSNEGIKAAATTVMGGAGATSCYYDYIYEVPVKKIDITFDKPYVYIIRDKDSGEVWFVGTVYTPSKN